MACQRGLALLLEALEALGLAGLCGSRSRALMALPEIGLDAEVLAEVQHSLVDAKQKREGLDLGIGIACGGVVYKVAMSDSDFEQALGHYLSFAVDLI
jgi:hypothetical protein